MPFFRFYIASFTVNSEKTHAMIDHAYLQIGYEGTHLFNVTDTEYHIADDHQVLKYQPIETS